MFGSGRPQTEVDQPGSRLRRPIDRADQSLYGDGKRVRKDFDCIQASCGRFLADGRCNCRPVSEPIHIVIRKSSIGTDEDPAGDPGDVRMFRMHAAVNDGNVDRFARSVRTEVKGVLHRFSALMMNSLMLYGTETRSTLRVSSQMTNDK